MTSLLRAAALFCFVVITGATEAEWQIVSSKSEPSPNDSVEHWTTAAEDAATGARPTLHAAVFETGGATLRVIDQAAPPRRELANVMAEIDALAGVNGGYFDPADAPVGLLVSEGRVLSPLRKAKLLSGVLIAGATRVDILRTARFSMTPKIKTAVQCGPLLVEGGAPVAGLNDTRPARRTFVAIDGRGQTALGLCSTTSLAQLARILSLPNSLGKMKVARALNLDGGSSSAFWFKGKDHITSLPELKNVRNFIAIVPRQSR